MSAITLSSRRRRIRFIAIYGCLMQKIYLDFLPARAKEFYSSSNQPLYATLTETDGSLLYGAFR